MKNRRVQNEILFFSMTLEFLETYLPRQLGRSPKTIKSYRDSLTVFRRYLYEECHISIATFKFDDCSQKCIQDFIVHLKNNGNSPGVCGKINLHTIAAQKYITPQAA